MKTITLDLFSTGALTEELTLAGQSVTDHAPLIAARLDAQAAAADLDARQIPLPEATTAAPAPVVTEPAADTDAEPTGRATYSPEDNKLRLYIGRVPRDEYESLRAEGWKALYKQREAGGGDFVATWTPARRDTALDYAAVIEDEDMGPAERAADRAERFAGYREKRTAEAIGRADKFDAGPSAHGFQSQARAERAARRHDRTAGRAVDAWDRAEYWQRRTAGVISHALHVSSPSVRMGRIKELESDIRKCEKSQAEHAETHRLWLECSQIADAAEQAKRAEFLAGATSHCYDYHHPRPDEVTNAHVREKGSSLWTLLTLERNGYGKSITGAEAVALYLSRHTHSAGPGDWLTHYRLRLAYETQMLEAQGGRAGELEIIAGGWIRGGRRLPGHLERQIVKVNKSPVSGRVVSVLVRDAYASHVNHWGNPFPDGVARVLSHTVEVERLSPDAYRPPTAEELAKFTAETKAAKAKRKATTPAKPPLVNPTDEDAARLVELWNNARRGEWERKHAPSVRQFYPFKPAEIRRISQETYSNASKQDRAETRDVCSLGRLDERQRFYDYDGQARRKAERGPVLCSIRSTGFDPVHLIILTDKPQKSLPAAVWAPYVAPAKVEEVATA